MKKNRSRGKPSRITLTPQSRAFVTAAFAKTAESMSRKIDSLLTELTSGETKTGVHAQMVLAHNVAMLLEKLNAENPLPAATASAAALGDVSFNVGRLREELAAAIERRPNRVLLELVHGLRTTRFELNEVQEQLQKNNALLERLMRDGIPTALPASETPGCSGSGALPFLLRRQG